MGIDRTAIIFNNNLSMKHFPVCIKKAPNLRKSVQSVATFVPNENQDSQEE
jgi:hypothetical protein